jgi:hypothetical protein
LTPDNRTKRTWQASQTNEVRHGRGALVDDGDLPEPADARLALEYATAALVAGQVDLARHIYVYAEVAACDRAQLPILLSMLTAVSGHLDDQPPPPAGEAPRLAGRLRSVGPRPTP